MAPSFRHRAALALSGALIVAPLLGMAEVDASTPTVTFTGAPLLNIGMVSCPSKPSVSTLRVAAGTTVNFADRLGKPATLWAGDSHESLSDGEMVPVTFTSGPAKIVIQMLPNCALDLGTHVQMTVTVTAPDTSPPGGSAGNGGGGGGGGDGTTTKAPGSSGSGRGATVGPTTKTDHPKDSHKPTPSAAPSTGAAVVTSAGPGDPGNTGSSQGAGAGNDDPFATPTITDTAGSVTLGDPVGAISPSNGASGLLTLIATVCVVGVSAAAIRAIIAQRATRALAA